LINFRRTQLGFENNVKWESLSLCFGGKSGGVERLQRKERKSLQVRCAAESIDRGMLIGRRGREEAKVINVPERFKVVALMACVMCLCNADRVVMSVAIVPLAAKHGWSNSFLGIVQVSDLLKCSLYDQFCDSFFFFL
jgi:ACS family sodium-dependent inorganic phosphate cotransporter